MKGVLAELREKRSSGSGGRSLTPQKPQRMRFELLRRFFLTAEASCAHLRGVGRTRRGGETEKVDMTRNPRPLVVCTNTHLSSTFYLLSNKTNRNDLDASDFL